MAVWSIVNKGKLRKNRLDPEYYKPLLIAYDKKYGTKNELRKYINKLTDYTANGSFASLKTNVIIQDKPDYAKWIRIQNLDTFDFENNIRYVNKHSYEFLKKSSLYGGEILFSKTGEYLGKAYIFPSLNEKVTLADNIFLINIDEKEILKEYFCVFINSKVGNELIIRNAQGTGQPTIIKESLRSIVIPIPDMQIQKEIQQLYIQSYKYLLESKLLYSQAEQILLEELGLKDLCLKDDLFYTTTLKKAKDNNRMDTYFFMPKFDIGLSKLKGKYKLKSVLELSRDVTTGQYCNEYIDRKSGIPYIRGTDISNATINEDNLMYVDNPKNNGSKKAKEGDVVTTRVGTIGLVARIPRELEGCIISDNLIRIRLPKKSEISSYYLTMYLNSPFGKDLMISYSRGSVQQRLNQETLKEIPIPIVSNSLQVKIERFLVESWEKRKKAKQLLEQAKHKVEEMIEKEAGVK